MEPFEAQERVNMVVTFDPLLTTPEFIATIIEELEGVETATFNPAH